jgi:quinol monooxygenase YgiN
LIPSLLSVPNDTPKQAKSWPSRQRNRKFWFRLNGNSTYPGLDGVNDGATLGAMMITEAAEFFKNYKGEIATVSAIVGAFIGLVGALLAVFKFLSEYRRDNTRKRVEYYVAIQDKFSEDRNLKITPARVFVFEIYADVDAYKAHLETAHFKTYKSATRNMVKSLKLRDTVPILLHAKPDASRDLT